MPVGITQVLSHWDLSSCDGALPLQDATASIGASTVPEPSALTSAYAGAAPDPALWI